ncbi:MAG: biotin/lipoyl-binding protein [Cytophagales bacterium]|nr:biotin/lipoyl-binding protein [Cytophagales bacterium]
MKNYKFKIHGNEYHVNIKETEANIIRLEVNGSSYEVEMEKEVKTSKTPVLVRGGTKPVQRVDNLSTNASTRKISAPLPGTVLKILVKEGDEVKTGDALMILEAMKMENTILAESSGKVQSIKVQENSTVLQGDQLLEII